MDDHERNMLDVAIDKGFVSPQRPTFHGYFLMGYDACEQKLGKFVKFYQAQVEAQRRQLIDLEEQLSQKNEEDSEQIVELRRMLAERDELISKMVREDSHGNDCDQ